VPIRLNIPPWGIAEGVALGRTLLPFPPRPPFTERLRTALAEAVPGRQPLPVRSARYGLALAVRALGLGGCRIAVPGYLCPAVLTGLQAAPATAVPVDTRPGSAHFDAEALRKAAEDGAIDAVLAPATYGLDPDFDALRDLGLPVIEDAAYQAGRLDAGGKPCGGRGDAGVWSFNFKALTAVGGGILWLPAELAEKAERDLAPADESDLRPALGYAVRALLRHRIPRRLPGFAPPAPPSPEIRPALRAPRRGPMSEVQAALALAQWHRRDDLATAQRLRSRQLAAAVARRRGLALLPGQPPDGAVHLLPVLARDAEAALRARRILYAAGVQTEEPYPVPFDAPLPNARALAARLFLVPAGPALGAAQIARIAAALEEAGEVEG
jgi:dTDP-4-amino-4,6-dideoxygalactose transaminase